MVAHLRRGFIANVINPKVALFFIAFLPQFVDQSRGAVWPQMLLLGALFAAQTVVIFGSLGWSAGGIGTQVGVQMGGNLSRQQGIDVVVGLAGPEQGGALSLIHI